jgi:hypothetical protein
LEGISSDQKGGVGTPLTGVEVSIQWSSQGAWNAYRRCVSIMRFMWSSENGEIQYRATESCRYRWFLKLFLSSGREPSLPSLREDIREIPHLPIFLGIGDSTVAHFSILYSRDLQLYFHFFMIPGVGLDLNERLQYFWDRNGQFQHRNGQF